MLGYRIDAVLFDLDGTLLDTAPDMARAANRVLADYDVQPLTAAQIQANTSYGANGLIKAGFGTIPAHLNPLHLRQQFLDYYHDEICLKTSMYDGIDTLLNYLNKNRVPWGIMTNKPEFLTQRLLPYFPVLSEAEVVVCGDTLDKAKPHPDPLWHACQLLNIPPESCLYVGDIEKDMIAARAARMPGAVAGWGYIGDEHHPDLWQAQAILPEPAALIPILEQHNRNESAFFNQSCCTQK
ncbi:MULTISPECIES: HAD family hydrolase [Photobacterium]|uniref:HAD family hydrolase n=1 Tax=Photobacterium TaxID=657 RepID=UPI0004236693|nr:HAD-IA family hydrolase [Photobacterium halotolerans]